MGWFGFGEENPNPHLKGWDHDSQLVWFGGKNQDSHPEVVPTGSGMTLFPHLLGFL